MIAEIATAVGLGISAWGGYRYFIASNLDAHVEAYGGAARLVVTNNRRAPAYLSKITAHRPRGAMLSKFDQVPLMIIGREPWNPPDYRDPEKVQEIKLDMEVAPKATVTYPFRFFSDDLLSISRIRLEAWESSLIARTKRIDCVITPKAINVTRKSTDIV